MFVRRGFGRTYLGRIAPVVHRLFLRQLKWENAAMTVTTSEYSCSVCNAPHFGEGGNPCEACGHIGRTIAVTIQESVMIRTGFRAQGYEGGKSRKKGFFAEIRERWQHSTKLGEAVHRVQHIDKRADRYTEVVRDQQGNIIHQTDEPLSAHRGHGSDKPELLRQREIASKKSDE